MMDSIFSYDTLWVVLMIMYVPACIGLILIVLLQKGKGTGFAGAFGAGAGPGSDTVFGPRMSRSLPVKLTYVAATLFMVIAVVMSLVAGRVGKGIAPELAEVTEQSASSSDGGDGGLLVLGLGSNEVDVSRAVEPEPETIVVQPEVAPIVEVEAPADEAPAESEAEVVEEPPADAAVISQ